MKRDFLFKSIRRLGKRGCLRGQGSGWHLRNGELTGAAGPTASRETVQMFMPRWYAWILSDRTELFFLGRGCRSKVTEEAPGRIGLVFV